jgi:hypothetical protein
MRGRISLATFHLKTSEPLEDRALFAYRNTRGRDQEARGRVLVQVFG